MQNRVVVVVVALVLLAAGAHAQTTTPVISSFNPKVAIAGTGQQTITVNGLNFGPSARLRVNNSARTTTVVSNTQLTATLFSADVSTSRTLSITVISGSFVSEPVQFQVLPNQPAIATINPSTLRVGSPDTTIRVTGENFAPTATVRIGTTDLVTSYIDQTALDATVPAESLRTAGSRDIRVENPNNRVSAAVKLTVTSGPIDPILSALDPNRAIVAQSPFEMTVIGQNFATNARVFFDTTEQQVVRRTDTTRIVVRVTATQLRTAKTFQVTARNGTLVSNALPFQVDQPFLPEIEAISPNTVRMGSSTATVAITGKRFRSDSRVRVNGVDRTPRYVNASRLDLTLNATDLKTAATLSITVFNSGTNGGLSNVEQVFVVERTSPIVDRTIPASLPVNTTELNIVVVGSGFDDQDEVLINNEPRPTTYSSSTRLGALLFPVDVATQRILLVRVRNRGGDVSGPVELQIVNAAVPAIETFNPVTGVAGATSQTLTINGRNFAASSIVRFDGQVVQNVEFVNDRQLTINLTAAQLATPRQVEITVATPTGLVSTPMFWQIIGIPPVITGLEPATAAAGDPGFTLTVSGSNFSSGGSIRFGDRALSTRFNSANGTLSATLTAGDLATAGAVQVRVVDRGLTSEPFTFQVLRPQVLGLTPAAIIAGSGDTIVVVRGSSFVPTSKVEFLGAERPTTFISATELRVTLPASTLTQAGDFAITVRSSPDTVSSPVFLVIAAPGSSTLESVSPAGVFAGSAATPIVVRGRNFVADSRVRVNGAELATTFVSATELRATLPADRLATPASLLITVATPDGPVSNALGFEVLPAGQGRRRGVGK